MWTRIWGAIDTVLWKLVPAVLVFGPLMLLPRTSPRGYGAWWAVALGFALGRVYGEVLRLRRRLRGLEARGGGADRAPGGRHAGAEDGARGSWGL